MWCLCESENGGAQECSRFGRVFAEGPWLAVYNVTRSFPASEFWPSQMPILVVLHVLSHTLETRQCLFTTLIALVRQPRAKNQC